MAIIFCITARSVSLKTIVVEEFDSDSATFGDTEAILGNCEDLLWGLKPLGVARKGGREEDLDLDLDLATTCLKKERKENPSLIRCLIQREATFHFYHIPKCENLQIQKKRVKNLFFLYTVISSIIIQLIYTETNATQIAVHLVQV